MHCPFQASGECKRTKCHLWVDESDVGSTREKQLMRPGCALRVTALKLSSIEYQLEALTEVIMMEHERVRS